MDFAMKNLHMMHTLSRSVVLSLFAHFKYFMFLAVFIHLFYLPEANKSDSAA